jgi:hypothetical protein
MQAEDTAPYGLEPDHHFSGLPVVVALAAQALLAVLAVLGYFGYLGIPAA